MKRDLELGKSDVVSSDTGMGFKGMDNLTFGGTGV
jgi:hypothetical protein